MTSRAKGRKERCKAEGDGSCGLGVASAVDSAELFWWLVFWQSLPAARWRSRKLPSHPPPASPAGTTSHGGEEGRSAESVSSRRGKNQRSDHSGCGGHEKSGTG